MAKTDFELFQDLLYRANSVLAMATDQFYKKMFFGRFCLETIKINHLRWRDWYLKKILSIAHPYLR